jgi:hypothetical protein
MNKNLSTRHHCAKHLSSLLVARSCLALIDDQHIWDINRPLKRDCKLKFYFMEKNVNTKIVLIGEHVRLLLDIYLKLLLNKIIKLSFVHLCHYNFNIDHLLMMLNLIFRNFINIWKKKNRRIYSIKEIGNLVMMIFVLNVEILHS